MRRRTRKNIAFRKNTARGLLFFNALLWLIYGIYIYYDMAVLNKNKTAADIVVISLFATTLLMFVSGIRLGKASRRNYYFALVVVVLNLLFALANITDLLYLSAFIIDLVILSTLFPLRDEYSSI